MAGNLRTVRCREDQCNSYKGVGSLARPASITIGGSDRNSLNLNRIGVDGASTPLGTDGALPPDVLLVIQDRHTEIPVRVSSSDVTDRSLFSAARARSSH